MDNCLETKSLEAWLRTAVSEHGFSSSEVDHLRSVASMFNSPYQLLHFDKRFFHYILATEHTNPRATDSVHITLIESGRQAVSFSLELASLSGFDIKFFAITEDMLLGQIFTESIAWRKGKQVQTVLFNLKDETTTDLDVHKEMARAYGCTDQTFLTLDPIWSSVATRLDIKTGVKKICQLCSMKQWPAMLVPDPRPGKSNLCLLIVSEDTETWKYGAEGDLVQYNLDDASTVAVQSVHDPRFCSQLLKYTNDGHRFVAYRKNNPEVLVYDAESLGLLLNVPLKEYTPFLDLPFQQPYILGILTETDLLDTIQAGVLTKRVGGLGGLAFRPEMCCFVVPAVSQHFLALAFFPMERGWDTVVKLYGPLARPLDEDAIRRLT